MSAKGATLPDLSATLLKVLNLSDSIQAQLSEPLEGSQGSPGESALSQPPNSSHCQLSHRSPFASPLVRLEPVQQLEGSGLRHLSYSQEPSLPTAPQRVGMLQWDPCSSDRLLLGATKDLAERLAHVTGRTLAWHDPLEKEVSGNGSDRLRASTEPSLASAVAVGKPSLKLSGPAVTSLAESRRGCSLACCFGGAAATSVVDPMPSGDGHAYGLFISYSRAEASAHARLLHALFEREMGRPAFLDATDAFDLNEILHDGIARSRALVLIQTRSTLRRP